MSDAIAELTDKEKEALRLLLAGHDAKTSANELGLSVHTINDRLRNARRKLGVSSSREAARILGDAEGGSPQNHAHSEFGMARGQSEPDPAILNQSNRTATSRTVWLAGGMLIMSIVLAAIVVGAVYTAEEPRTETSEQPEQSQSAGPLSEADEIAAVERAETFVALVDDGRWEDSWENAGPYFQSQASVAEWTSLIEAVRPELGEVRSREVVQTQHLETVPGAPEGDYTILQFSTEFANREEAIETIMMMRGDDGLQVVGYFIQ
ncbi:helix-turn-helix domain-containing protein [Erythrobacter alti]|uniref:helix-turn-helix domain-containing protein n=1 Tax=Erythrobacter alti TaxID=1896145 RepID=UPI0030F3FC8D